MSTKRKLAIIGIVGLPAKYGGFESFAEHLVEKLAHDFEITVYCSSRAYENRPATYKGAHLKYLRLNANGISSIFYDAVAMLNAIRRNDTLLILGVSGCVFLPFARLLRPHTRIVVNIDGIEWRREKWTYLIRLFLWFSEWCAIRFSDVVVADNKAISDYLRQKRHSGCSVIEYGADHVAKLPMKEDLQNRFPFLKAPYAFEVCRIEPENNVHVVLAAFANRNMPPLVMVGNWMASVYGRDLRTLYADNKNLLLLDPIYEPGILDRLRSNCCLYVHGHSCGGTNPSLVEAMYLGLPIVAFDVSFNRETTENKAAYFKDETSLVSLISSLHDEKRKQIAEAMREIAVRRYNWNRIAHEYAVLFADPPRNYSEC